MGERAAVQRRAAQGTVRCDACQHEDLLAFSCTGCWFCPSCHLPAPRRLRHAGQKNNQIFGTLRIETILSPVPHRPFTFGIPTMLRPYCRFDLDLHKGLHRQAHERLIEHLRTTLGLPDGLPGIIIAIHTFGQYLDFHPHLHALVADGLSVSGETSGDHASTPNCIFTFAMQHGMLRVVQRKIPLNDRGIDRLNGFTGASGQAFTEPPDAVHNTEDKLTGDAFSRRVAEAAVRWAKGA